jgi:hypothetical protein
VLLNTSPYAKYFWREASLFRPFRTFIYRPVIDRFLWPSRCCALKGSFGGGFGPDIMLSKAFLEHTLFLVRSLLHSLLPDGIKATGERTHYDDSKQGIPLTPTIHLLKLLDDPEQLFKTRPQFLPPRYIFAQFVALCIRGPRVTSTG